MAIDEKIAKRPPFTEEEKDLFLALIEDGLDKVEAAAKIQEQADAEGRTCRSTPRRWTGLYRRDPEFRERYRDALKEAGKALDPAVAEIEDMEALHFAARLFEELKIRSLDPERGRFGAANRMTHNIALLVVPLMKPLLEARTRVIHQGAVGIYAMPQIDYSGWTLDEHREWVALERRRNELLTLVRVDGSPQMALSSGEAVGDSEVVEGEAIEETPGEV